MNKNIIKKIIKDNYFIIETDILKNLFFDACKNGNLAVVKYLLYKHNVDIDSSDFNGGSSGLRLASSNGHLNIVKFLLSDNKLIKHSDFYLSDNFSSCPAFRMACNNKRYKIIKYFIDNNYIINDRVLKRIVKNAYLKNNNKILKLLIFEYKIPYSSFIKDYIEKYKWIKLRKMFEQRE